jgi:hypothetical protein
MVLMTQNWKKCTAEKKNIFSFKNLYLLIPIKDTQAAGEAFSPQKRSFNTHNM